MANYNPTLPHGIKNIDISGNELNTLANSPDGKAVQAILGADEERLKSAIQNNDTDALKEVMNKLLKTQSGKNIVNQLSQLLK